MYTASELLEALRARPQRGAVWFRDPDQVSTRASGDLPPAWQYWLTTMRPRPGALTGATPQALAAIFIARELAKPPRRVQSLNRWQAFATLWRQQWQPPAREERSLRLSAVAGSSVLHVLFAAILLWLMYLRFMLPPPGVEETVVQVEYIGTGTPEDTGGAAPAQTTPATAAAAPTASAATAAAAAPAQPPPAAERPSAQSGAQPLQVTEVLVPDTEFTLPPPTPRIPDLPQPDIRVSTITAPTPDITVVELPAPLPRPVPVPARPTPAVQVPELTRPPEIVMREIPAPLPQVTTRALAEQPVRTPALQTPTPTVRPRDIPAPAAATAPAASTAAAASASPSTRPAAAASSNAARPASDAGQANTAAAGKGPTASPKPGATPNPARGDDWGAAARNRPGAATGPRGERPGLFNADGSPRLAQTPPAAAPGAPPGSTEQRIADLDRAGTWLKRPPYDYTPTRFERFWVPSETLLAEWVRKGIKSVAIPIPGTSKKLTCVVSLLQLGGGCGISDPNLNEQPATARPPPDIPFKKKLQEDNGSR